MEIVKYDIETAVITALEARYADIKVVDGKSKAVAMEGLAEYRELRAKIDKRHKELKKDALKYGRAVDNEKNRLKGLLAPVEQHLKDARQIYDDKIKAKKAEKERIEQERVDKIAQKIQSLDHAVDTALNMSSGRVVELCDEIVAIQITEEVFQEFAEQAKAVKLTTLSALDDIYNDKVTREKADAERRAEIEKLEKIRKENEAAQAKIDQEKAEFEAAKKAEQEKQERAEFERKAKRQAEQEVQQKEKEKIEAENEAKRQTELLPDKEKLIAFSNILANIEMPHLKSKNAKKILNEICIRIIELADVIKEQAESM